jgi:hypothetical protein
VQDPEGAAEVVLRVTLDTDVDPKGGKIYDLTEHGEITQSAALQSSLPTLEEGELELVEYGADNGAKVEGTFSAAFVTEADETLQLQGGFKTELEVIDL